MYHLCGSTLAYFDAPARLEDWNWEEGYVCEKYPKGVDGKHLTEAGIALAGAVHQSLRTGGDLLPEGLHRFAEEQDPEPGKD
ncbi:hypothetical protein N7462_010976 [Penicillium macrosclerotiorum]|uniref:uncharacterized protein n=1 Tax=Penicillium macrosclerotiorum TaxID=303699 RepID=UPI002546A2C8|nr:uncharacterized protein N7462_010976 [Penicillium macrosclerotiorum]KAJ5666567.1 hypothetical protein N7462_010976 [Penicillium macrosclerotiorum]